MSKKTMQKKISEKGFSIIELLVVLAIASILAGISTYYLTSHQKLYQPDDQALKIVDILQEARQRSLTQRETMRVEINATLNIVRLIDENSATTADDDREIKRLTLFNQNEVKFTTRSNNIAYNPPETLPIPSAVFTPSVYPSSATQNVCTIRFLSNGTVVNAGTDATGSNAVPTGVTLHIWSPSKSNANNSDIARAITIISSSGSMRLWEFDKNLAGSNKWKDSRRISIY